MPFWYIWIGSETLGWRKFETTKDQCCCHKGYEYESCIFAKPVDLLTSLHTTCMHLMVICDKDKHVQPFPPTSIILCPVNGGAKCAPPLFIPEPLVKMTGGSVHLPADPGCPLEQVPAPVSIQERMGAVWKRVRARVGSGRGQFVGRRGRILVAAAHAKTLCPLPSPPPVSPQSWHRFEETH